MSFDGFGVFTRAYNWVADKANGIKIQAARMDGEFDNFATALNQVILRNGVVPFTGTLKLGGNLLTGLAAGAVGAPGLSFSGDTTTGVYQPSAGVVAVSVAGVERGRFSAAGFISPTIGIGGAAPRTPLDVVGIASFRGAFEDVVISATSITGTVQLDYLTAAVFMFNTNAAGNWTFNIRGDGANSLNSIMGIGQMLTLAVECPQGGTPYYCTAITVDGAAPAALKWSGASGAPTSGNASSIDVYLIRVIKTANATFLVRASQSPEA